MKNYLLIYFIFLSNTAFSQCYIGLSMQDVQNIYKDKLIFYRYDSDSKYVEMDLDTKVVLLEFKENNDIIIRYTSIFFNDEFLNNELKHNNSKYLKTSDSTWVIDLIDGNKISIYMGYSIPFQRKFLSYEQIGKVNNTFNSMNGIKIGDPITKLKDLGLKIIDDDGNSIKYKTVNGNDFSLTHHNGKVVYMENDWMEMEKGKIPLISNFVFGKTTIEDIRNYFGTNGFVYNKIGMSTLNDVVMINCYSINSVNGEVLVFITKSAKSDISKNKDRVDELLKLNAIILAKEDYLDYLWGDEKTFDPNYKKINK